jgi:hypothetical protein
VDNKSCLIQIYQIPVLENPNFLWVPLLENNDFVYLCRDQKMAQVVWTWDKNRKMIGLKIFGNDRHVYNQNWYVNPNGDGFDGKPIMLPTAECRAAKISPLREYERIYEL